MLRLLSLSILVLLLCSCVQTQLSVQDETKRREIRELIARREEQKKFWENTFNQLPGTPVSRLIQIWGKPEKIKNNEYHWVSRYTLEKGGYYVTDGETRHTIRDKNGYAVGSIETPRERYVEPYTTEGIFCEILVTARKNGIITHVNFDDVTNCMEYFPFPEK